MSCGEPLEREGIPKRGGVAVGFHEQAEIGRDEGRGGDASRCHELQDNGSNGWNGRAVVSRQKETKLRRGELLVFSSPRPSISHNTTTTNNNWLQHPSNIGTKGCVAGPAMVI